MQTNIADRPLSLAGHLRNVADQLRNGTVEYGWGHPATCNCGLLARSVLGISRAKLEKMIPEESGTWQEFADEQCPLSGLPHKKIFRQLTQAGFVFGDFKHLESLSHRSILAKTTKTLITKRFLRPDIKTEINLVSHKDSEYEVALYMETWAGMIEEFNKANARPSDAHLEQVELRPLVKS